MTSTTSSREAEETDSPLTIKGEDFAFDTRTVVWVIFNAVFAQLAFGLQVFEDVREEFRIFAAEFAHGFAAARGFAVFVLRGGETCFVNVESLFAGDVAGDFEGQAVGGVQVEGFVTIEEWFWIGGAKLVESRFSKWAVPASTVRAKRTSSRVRLSKIVALFFSSSG